MDHSCERHHSELTCMMVSNGGVCVMNLLMIIDTYVGKVVSLQLTFVVFPLSAVFLTHGMKIANLIQMGQGQSFKQHCVVLWPRIDLQ